MQKVAEIFVRVDAAPGGDGSFERPVRTVADGFKLLPLAILRDPFGKITYHTGVLRLVGRYEMSGIARVKDGDGDRAYDERRD